MRPMRPKTTERELASQPISLQQAPLAVLVITNMDGAQKSVQGAQSFERLEPILPAHRWRIPSQINILVLICIWHVDCMLFIHR